MNWHHLGIRVLIVVGTTCSVLLRIKKIVGNIFRIEVSFKFGKITLFSVTHFTSAIDDTLGEDAVRQSMSKGVFLLCSVCHLTTVDAWWHTCISSCLSKSIYFSTIVVLTHTRFTALFIFKNTRCNQILFNCSDISTRQSNILSLIPNFIWINLNWILVLIHCSGLVWIPTYCISIYFFPNDILSFSTLNFWRRILSIKKRIRTFEIQIIFSTHVEVEFLSVFCDLFEKWVFFPIL